METKESRDSPTITVESGERKQMTISPTPPSDKESISNSRHSDGSYRHHHQQHEHYLNRRDGIPRSPANRPTSSSPFGHARVKSLGSSSLFNTPLLVSPDTSPHSPRGSYHSSPRSHPSLTYFALDGHTLGGRVNPPLLNPVRPHPPRISQVQKAMETAIVAERKRAKEMQCLEETMTGDELRAVLKQERHRMSQLAADLAKHRTMTVQCQLEAEVLEEGRVNGLMRRLEELQLEKGRIIIELEQEEEMVRWLGLDCSRRHAVVSLYLSSIVS